MPSRLKLEIAKQMKWEEERVGGGKREVRVKRVKFRGVSKNGESLDAMFW